MNIKLTKRNGAIEIIPKPDWFDEKSPPWIYGLVFGVGALIENEDGVHDLENEILKAELHSD